MLQLRVLVFVRIPPLKFWAGPDDVKRQDARAKSTPMLPASIRVCSPDHHAINQLGMPHHWAAPDRLAAALFVSASLRQDGQVEKGSLQLLWDVTYPKHCLPCPRTQAPTSKGPPSQTRVFSMRWRSRLSPSQIVVRCLGGPMHSSARCPKGVEVRAVPGGHWALGPFLTVGWLCRAAPSVSA